MGMQKLLRAAGHEVTLDGLFGKSTAAAVEAFQTAVGLERDGIVGPRTWAALYGDTVVVDREKPVHGARLGYAEQLFHTSISPTHVQHLKIARFAAIYRTTIETIAHEVGVPASLVAAMGSRESRWGLALTPVGPAGKGDGGHGRGLLQIDDRSHEFARSGRWQDPQETIRYGVNYLATCVDSLRATTKLRDAALLRAAVAGYNCGCGNVRKALVRGCDVDYFTAHRDYSKDVFNRAGWFQLIGWS